MKKIDIEKEYYLQEIKKYYKIEELLEDRLWVASTMEMEIHQTLIFLKFNYSDDDGINVTTLFSIEGPIGNLKEGRHTYFPENGYIFYMNYEEMCISLNHCKKYFEMDS